VTVGVSGPKQSYIRGCDISVSVPLQHINAHQPSSISDGSSSLQSVAAAGDATTETLTLTPVAATATDQRTVLRLVHLSMRLGEGRQLVIDLRGQTRASAEARFSLNCGGARRPGEV